MSKRFQGGNSFTGSYVRVFSRERFDVPSLVSLLRRKMSSVEFVHSRERCASSEGE